MATPEKVAQLEPNRHPCEVHIKNASIVRRGKSQKGNDYIIYEIGVSINNSTSYPGFSKVELVCGEQSEVPLPGDYYLDDNDLRDCIVIVRDNLQFDTRQFVKALRKV